jgi:hypothetical protein
MIASSNFHLEIQRVQESCWVRLSWGNGLQLKAELPYPATLDQLYLPEFLQRCDAGQG